MNVKKLIPLVLVLVTLNVSAQYTGPSKAGNKLAVSQIADARLGSYIVVTGNITSHLTEEYYSFQDETGQIRVEIENSVWQSREVASETKVRLLAEIDTGLSGRYLWVKSLELVAD
ncbi:MAG: hypothetical protein ACI82S_001966 [Patiriisocius sp.]|jgi:uncharacterized protein (TIGR00156 family)